ncbi:hypothetical protein MLD38_028113 [Melastoma candidum]|uniref:Uncharacterized protein n=1 Tax=Melastoma candidum TaxID=119954 RepID=A0ACB9N634_9MYRT|nr:hypothetical protein MLD38_028113 [Melastoma candidum]
MGRSRRKYKKSRPKVKVGLPKKNPRIVKPSFNLHPKFIRSFLQQRDDAPEWDAQGTVINNYSSFGVASDPNHQLDVPPGDGFDVDAVDSGSDLEEDDLKSALGKKRRDGKSAPLQPLTAMQRVHISLLVEKYGDDYQRMFMDTKLNSLQHSVATLEKLCKRFHMNRDKNLLIVSNYSR